MRQHCSLLYLSVLPSVTVDSQVLQGLAPCLTFQITTNISIVCLTFQITTNINIVARVPPPDLYILQYKFGVGVMHLDRFINFLVHTASLEMQHKIVCS